MLQHFIEKYNRLENIILISSYPQRNTRYSQKTCAVAGFAKNTLQAIQTQYPNKRFIVLTTTINNKAEIYEEDNNLICRFINRSNPLSYFKLITLLFKLTKIKNVLIEFEFGSFGNVKNTSFFLIVPLVLKLLGKKIIIVFHQVAAELKELHGHLGWNQNDIRAVIYDPLLKIFYKILYCLSTNIIVTEQVFKRKLKKIVGCDRKTAIIPHGVDTKLKLMSKQKSRQLLGLPKNKLIVMYFGYLAWYKGADLFIKYARRIRDKKILFLLAGGKSFTNTGKKFYEEYLGKFIKLPRNVILTGFVPENKISYYYNAADIIALPYRTMISSSGPLSLAFSFKKPVILSKNLSYYLETPGFCKNLIKAGLTEKDIFFGLNKDDFKNKIASANTKKLTEFSRLMRLKRNYLKLSGKIIDLFKTEKEIKKTISYKFRLAKI